MHGDFFWRFLLSRNYKIQVIVHVGRKSAVVLSGLMEASYSHFFIGIDFDCSAFSGVRREASKTIAHKPPGASRVEESDSPRRGLHF